MNMKKLIVTLVVALITFFGYNSTTVQRNFLRHDLN